MDSFTSRVTRLSYEHRWIRQILAPAIAARRVVLGRQRSNDARYFDRLATLLVEDPCLHVLELDGRFYLDPRSDLFRRIIHSGAYEPELTRLCRRFLDPRRDALDVGANIGFHSVLFGKALEPTARVLAFEPTSAARRRLTRNLILNGVQDRVSIVEAAASRSEGTAVINVVPGREEYSSLGDLAHPSVDPVQGQKESVRLTTIDTQVSAYKLSPGSIKIDVEGSEYAVLEGAADTLERCRPVILAELSDALLRKSGASVDLVLQFLRSHRYDVYDPLEPTLEPGSREFGDVICFPREQDIDFRRRPSR